MKQNLKICFMNKPSKRGGPGTFQVNFEKYLKKNSVEVIYPEDNKEPDLIIIISGTRRLFWVISKKIKGVKVIQRLDGMNWKFQYQSIGLLEKIKQRLQNFLMAFIRRYIADHIIYQSKFIEEWWNIKYGIVSNNSIIPNGTILKDKLKIDLDHNNELIITCIEGNIQNDEVTIATLDYLNNTLIKNPRIDKIEIYGDTSLLENYEHHFKNISFEGYIERDKIKNMLIKNRRIFFLLELNPPCPNSMIEAISAGLPCIGFDTGSFKELLSGAGKYIPYDANVWKLEKPDFSLIYDEIEEMIDKYEFYKKKSLEISKKYEIENIFNLYFQVIQKLV
mgnify:CR=1 FL=1|tara:strand:- start:157 stop:1161 length:1005 start_codon:yes stop_codon:yes gene_type:complete